MLKYLLDTNIVIYVLKQRPISVLGRFNENAQRMAISSITLAELYYGAEKSQRVAQNLEAIEEFTSLLPVMGYDAAASRHYGEIKASLESKGEVIGINDMHIAAHARSQGLILVSNNLKELGRVPFLQTENWAESLG
jgi:tRNA(fMet)-specific endonuclease VapC